MNIISDVNNSNFFNNKNILITGGTGSLGNSLTNFFLNLTNIKRLCIFSRDEFKQHRMKKRLKNNVNFDKLRFFLGDIRDLERLKYATRNIDIVFHAAALKQVDSIEYNPMEAIKTNVLGTQNVVISCIENNVDQLIGISTDKCVAPVNLYGATKLCLEKLIISGYEYSGFKLKTSVLRYGNVIGSRGSVVPLFKEQINSGKFNVTDKRMTRFTLTLEQATNFILNCVSISNGGEIFVPKLKKYNLPQLCNVINSKNEINEIGIRPGEKLHEEMIAEAESLNVWESENFFIIESSGCENNKHYRISESLINKFNLKKRNEIFVYSSKNSELISDDELHRQIYL